MSAEETYFIVWVQGAKYVVHADEERMLERITVGHYHHEWIPLRTPEGNPPVMIRVSSIDSYFLSTPDIRARWKDWYGEEEEEWR